jgi:heptosyltransferase-2/heptosyltransferase-3
MKESGLDRDGLIRRNRAMAEAFHATPLKHRLRQSIINLSALIPIPRARVAASQRILLIRPDHLGDALLTTPAVRALRTALPYMEIHMLVGQWSAEALAAYPEIDQILTLPFPGFSRAPKENWRSPYQLAFRTARHLRRIGYSGVVILRPDHWWGAFTARLAGIPIRIGYNLPGVAPFLTHKVKYQRQHAVLQNLRLVERWTGAVPLSATHYTFPVEAVDQQAVNAYLQARGVKPRQPIFCVHPGSGTLVKHWQEDRWAQVADILSVQLGAYVVFTGSPHELPLVQRIVGYMKQPSIASAGDTNVGQLAALFQRAQIVLGPDSGPLHLAAAVGTPTVALFGPADPAEFAPWGAPEKHIILTSDIGCRPCRVLDWGSDAPENHPCLRDIPIARVLEAARRLVQAG